MRIEDLYRDYLSRNGVVFEDKDGSFGPDFRCEYMGKFFAIDVKEKKRPYNKMWSDLSGIPRGDVFILDETAVKQIFNYYPNGFFLIMDNVMAVRRFTVINCFDLMTMPKTRVNRPIEKTFVMQKGKWIIDLKMGEQYADPEQALLYILVYVRDYVGKMMDAINCYGAGRIPFIDLPEDFARKKEHWVKDLGAPR